MILDVLDGDTIHLVKGNSSKPVQQAPAVTAPPTSSNANSTLPQTAPNNPSRGFGNIMAPGNMDFGGMQQQLMQNPDMMQQMLNSPMMENLMNNPDLMRNLMLSNPQMQNMLDSNPQIRHILNDPAVG